MQQERIHFWKRDLQVCACTLKSPHTLCFGDGFEICKCWQCLCWFQIDITIPGTWHGSKPMIDFFFFLILVFRCFWILCPFALGTWFHICSWINTFQSSLQFMSILGLQPGLGTYVNVKTWPEQRQETLLAVSEIQIKNTK